MARHQQKPTKPSGSWVCINCKEEDCENCVDVVRVAVFDNPPMLCDCKLAGHSGEPVNQQILDPTTGTVHGPHATISSEGEVYVEPEWKRAFREKHGG